MKKYTLEELYDLWIIWIIENNINVQRFYEDNNIDKSFVLWLEEREKYNSEV